MNVGLKRVFKVNAFRSIRTTHPGHRKMRTEHSENLLDDLDSSSKRLDSKSQGKLHKKLELNTQSEVSPEQRGILETTGEEIADVLNELFGSTKLQGTFRNVKTTADVVDVECVTLNQDYSHATAAWQSPYLDDFLKGVERTRGFEESERLKIKACKNITERLQRREPRMRAELAKKMNFKRIPRIYFVPWSKPGGNNVNMF